MLKSTLLLTLVGVALSSVLIFSPEAASAGQLRDPILEYNYHLKVDLGGIKSTAYRFFHSDDFEPDVAAKMEEIYNWLGNLGVYDLTDVTMDFTFEEDHVVGNTLVKFSDRISTRESIRDFIFDPPSASVLRAMIPEEDTLAWFTVMNPQYVRPIMNEIMKMPFGNCGDKKREMAETCSEFMDGFFKYVGDEAHFVLFDVMPNMMGYSGLDAAFVCSMDESFDDAGMTEIAKMIDGLFEKFKATKTVSKWEMFTVTSFSDFGCPAPVTPCYVVDKNFFIFATTEKALDKAAGHVLNPIRTAQSGIPPVMNAMVTVNVDKLMKMIPPEAGSMMAMGFGDDPHDGKLISMIGDEDWGTIRLVRSHQPDGILIECGMNRVLYSLMFHVWREMMIMGFTEEIKNSMPNREDMAMDAAHSIQLALERWATDHAGYYPEKPMDLITDGYMAEFPFNPNYDRPMQEAFIPGTAGDYYYVPKLDEDGKAYGFWLLIFGDEENMYDEINDQALIEDKTVIEEPDGVTDNVLTVLHGGAI